MTPWWRVSEGPGDDDGMLVLSDVVCVCIVLDMLVVMPKLDSMLIVPS